MLSQDQTDDKIQQLPDELLIRIFLELDIKSLITSAQVSRRFRKISGDDSIWKRKFITFFEEKKLLTPASFNDLKFLKSRFLLLNKRLTFFEEERAVIIEKKKIRESYFANTIVKGGGPFVVYDPTLLPILHVLFVLSIIQSLILNFVDYINPLEIPMQELESVVKDVCKPQMRR